MCECVCVCACECVRACVRVSVCVVRVLCACCLCVCVSPCIFVRMRVYYVYVCHLHLRTLLKMSKNASHTGSLCAAFEQREIYTFGNDVTLLALRFLRKSGLKQLLPREKRLGAKKRESG